MGPGCSSARRRADPPCMEGNQASYWEGRVFRVALDTRGHGDSDWAPDGNYGMDAMVQDLCVSSRRSATDARFWSALRWAAEPVWWRRRGSCRRHCPGSGRYCSQYRQGGLGNIEAFMRQKPEGFISLEEVAEAIGVSAPSQASRNLDGLAKNVRLGADGKYRWHWDPCSGAIWRLENRQVRLDACAGQADPAHNAGAGGALRPAHRRRRQGFPELCPHSEYANVADAAHMVAGDRNDIFGNAVIDFLSRAVPVGGDPLQPPHKPHPHREGPAGDINDVP